MSNVVFASVISELQQSPIFMTAKVIICDTPEANLNGAKVTEAFVNEVIKNEKRYVGLPLYADVKALTNGDYNRLGHLYDVKTGEFHSTQIGSFYKFEKEKFENGYHLVGYARIPKRNKKLSCAISELFADGRLKFSFEVAVGEYEENDDGTITIDASENNYLEGTAIVTYPACEDAVALELVAQKTDVQEGGEQDMEKNLTAEQEKVEETKEVAETKEETETKVETEVKAEEEDASCKKKKEDASAEEEKASEEPVQNETSTAEVYVTETTTEAREVHAFDTSTGKSVHQEVVVRTTTDNTVDGTLVEADDGLHVAEAKETAEQDSDNSGVVTAAGGDTDSGDATTETPAKEPSEETQEDAPAKTLSEETEEEEVPVTDSVDKKKTAEQMIAELAEIVENLKSEIAALKETKIVAEKTTSEINPLMADINTQKKYGLLEKEEKKSDTYSLLEKY